MFPLKSLGYSFALIGVSALLSSVQAQNTASHLIQLDAKINTTQQPITLYLRKGTYSVTPVGQAQGAKQVAWSVWDNTRCEKAQGCPRTVPTRYTGFHNNYYVLSPQISAVKAGNLPLTPVSDTPKYRLNSYFLANAKERAYEITEPKVYGNPTEALAGAQASQFTLEESGKVRFALLDKSRTADNRGGMALRVQLLPE